MTPFMEYILREFGTATSWNSDNSYSSLTATSDALLAFTTPSTLSLNVSSLSTANFATAYTFSTVGQIDGSISYLYTTTPLHYVPARSPTIPLRRLVPGYRDINLPVQADDVKKEAPLISNGRKPTVLHATMLLPPPSTLTALYARRLNPKTMLSISLNSHSVQMNPTSGPLPASVLAHLQYDTGRYTFEGLGSTDSGLLGVRGLWNFGVSPTPLEKAELEDVYELEAIEGNPAFPIDQDAVKRLSSYYTKLASRPSLLSAGAEFYYSPFSHVIGLSTGLRFTTLASHISPSISTPSDSIFSAKPLAGTSAAFSNALLAPSNVVHSSFPYTMTLTLTPLTGSLASTYSVKPSETLALSSRFDFNVYSWESKYTVGAEIWRKRKQRNSKPQIDPEGNLTWPTNDPSAWAHHHARDWFTPAERELKEQRRDREEENFVKVAADDGWNIRALWTGRVKSLLLTAGVSISPLGTAQRSLRAKPAENLTDDEGRTKRWTGTVGLSVAYST